MNSNNHSFTHSLIHSFVHSSRESGEARRSQEEPGGVRRMLSKQGERVYLTPPDSS